MTPESQKVEFFKENKVKFQFQLYIPIFIHPFMNHNFFLNLKPLCHTYLVIDLAKEAKILDTADHDFLHRWT